MHNRSLPVSKRVIKKEVELIACYSVTEAIIRYCSLIEYLLERRIRIQLVHPKSKVYGLDLGEIGFFKLINMAYGLSIISHELCEDIHRLRIIRNYFAHKSIHEIDSNKSWEDQKKVIQANNRLIENFKSLLAKYEDIRNEFPLGNYGETLIIAIVIVRHLIGLINRFKKGKAFRKRRVESIYQ